MATNPNPARITAASWWFMQRLLELEPGTLNGGIYTSQKAGYHNTRANLLAVPAWRDDYSLRSPNDRVGPADKAAGYDWTFPPAQAGNYTSIVKYGVRIRAAFNARDPRLAGWREALGQADHDKTAEGFNFGYGGWYQRTPDPSHAWHWHFSENRRWVEDWRNKRAMLSVLRGDSLAQWKAEEATVAGILTDADRVAIWTHDLVDGPGVELAYVMLNRAANDATAAKNTAALMQKQLDALAARPAVDLTPDQQATIVADVVAQVVAALPTVEQIATAVAALIPKPLTHEQVVAAVNEAEDS